MLTKEDWKNLDESLKKANEFLERTFEAVLREQEWEKERKTMAFLCEAFIRARKREFFPRNRRLRRKFGSRA